MGGPSLYTKKYYCNHRRFKGAIEVFVLFRQQVQYLGLKACGDVGDLMVIFRYFGPRPITEVQTTR